MVLAWVGFELICSLTRGAAIDNGVAIRNTGFLFVTMFGAPFLAWRALSTSIQAHAAEHGQLTERFTRAVEQLAAVHQQPTVLEISEQIVKLDTEKPNIGIRIGGLFALERISRNSESDHIAVMEIVSAYIRDRANLNSSENLDTKLLYPLSINPKSNSQTYQPPLDISVALKLLSQRNEERIKYEINERFWLDLSNVSFLQCDMEKAKLSYASLSNTDFTDAFLGAAQLKLAWLYLAKFDRTVMRKCNMDGAGLPKADLRNAIELKVEQIERAFGVLEGDFRTLLPSDIPPPVDWFKPSSPDISKYDFFQEFRVKHKEHCKRHDIWYPFD